ncbi:glycosyltransferase [Enterococcus faecium]|uniref:glycosyltransferase n=1 Tax=Enterococcus faecium TaxID=1352 RepID=UPI0029539C25|nr:glycosyltransferase [Enterococcus faecium]MDV7750678.1 glycosyltransferase [Enterococcus faecium]
MDNIAIIITKLNGGGAERCAANLSIELSKQYNVFLIVFDGSDITYPYGGKLINLNLPDSSSSIKRYLNVLKRANLVRKIKKANKISCSISLLDGPNLVNALSRCGEKTIVSIRNRLSSEYVNSLRRKLIIFSSMKTDLTVCLSKMVEKDMHEVFGIPNSKLTTIYNHVDAQLLHDLVQNSDKPSFIDDDNVYITTMGRLNEQKGQWHLLRAFPLVLEAIPEAKLVIMGEGELEDELKKLAKSLNIEEKVIFTGYIKNPHNVLLYSEMFVFPSLFEGLGNVLLEALAFNMPIVSADCIAGPREILAPDTDLNTKLNDIEYAKYGVLVPTLDIGHFNAEDALSSQEICLANAIIELHKNGILREDYINKAGERLKTFEKERIIEQWKAVF